jgi:hypothetical protein
MKSLMNSGLNAIQLQLLKNFSYEFPEDQLLEVKDLLSKYFAEKATTEMDIFLEQNNFDETTIEVWKNMQVRSE